jgi:hypothetical protein
VEGADDEDGAVKADAREVRDVPIPRRIGIRMPAGVSGGGIADGYEDLPFDREERDLRPNGEEASGVPGIARHSAKDVRRDGIFVGADRRGMVGETGGDDGTEAAIKGNMKHDNKWIAVTERLPEMGKRVEVKGAHTPEGYGWPIAYRRQYGAILLMRWYWESIEWRGTVGITHWREIEIVPLEKLETARSERGAINWDV